MPGPAEGAFEQTSIHNCRPADARAERKHKNVLTTARGATPSFTRQCCVSVIQDWNLASSRLQKFCPVQSLQSLQSSRHSRDGKAVTRREAGRGDTDALRTVAPS